MKRTSHRILLTLCLLWPGICVAQITTIEIPKQLYVCDILATAKTCGTWVWNGKYYEAAWPEGSTGKMTVERFDSDAIIVHRVNLTGQYRGLTSTYTGRWDGKNVQNGSEQVKYGTAESTMSWTAVAPTADTAQLHEVRAARNTVIVKLQPFDRDVADISGTAELSDDAEGKATVRLNVHSENVYENEKDKSLSRDQVEQRQKYLGTLPRTIELYKVATCQLFLKATIGKLPNEYAGGAYYVTSAHDSGGDIGLIGGNRDCETSLAGHEGASHTVIADTCERPSVLTLEHGQYVMVLRGDNFSVVACGKISAN